MRIAPIMVLGFVAASAIILFSGCGPNKNSDDKPALAAGIVTPVSVATVKPRNLVETIQVTGTLKPANEVEVGPRFSGRISGIIGKEGAVVQRGDVVARLDDTDAQIQVRNMRAAKQGAEARLAQAIAAANQQVSATAAGITTAQAALDAARARQKQAQSTRDATRASTLAGIKQAEEALRSAKVRLDQLNNGSRAQEKKIAENNVRLAEATYNNDKLNYERLRALFDQKAVAQSQVDNAEARMKISEAQYQSAQQQLSMIQEGPRAEDKQAAEIAVKQAEAALEVANAGKKQIDVAEDNVVIAQTGVKQAQAALDSAISAKQINVMRDKDVQAANAGLSQAEQALAAALQSLDYTMIYSPVDGVVSKRKAEVGQSVGNGDTILTLTTNKSLFFEANISELEATRLRAGQQVSLSVDALQGNRENLYDSSVKHMLMGTVEKVVPVVNDKTRNFTVRIVVAKNESLFPGMFARGTITVARHDRVVTAPKDALVQRGDTQVVFVAEDGKARAIPVVTGATDGTNVQIISGLMIGQQIITSGQAALSDGDDVEVKDAKSPSAPPAAESK